MTDTNYHVVTIEKASEYPREPIKGKPTLVYWDIVGIVHPLRMALASGLGTSNEEWYDVRAKCGTSSDSTLNKKEWWDAKASLRNEYVLDFPNLPYYMDSDVTLVQSDAILRYLGNKYNLMGGGSESALQPHIIDMLLEQARDLDTTLVRLSYEEGSAAVAKWLGSSQLRDELDIWNKYIQRNGGKFVTGSKLNVVDLKLYSFLFKFQSAQAALMVGGEANVPALPFFVPAYLEQVKQATPQLEAYLDSADMKIPMNNSHARFQNF
jgi:glutathione S-transferase